MKYVYLVVCMLVSFSYQSLALSGENPQSPILLDEKLVKENSEILKQIQEDFKLAEAGKKPKFAKFDKGQPLLADGGTINYKGKGYSITIQKTIGKLFGIDGYFYGPILKIENEELNSSAKNISSIRFYSTNEFKLFKKDKE